MLPSFKPFLSCRNGLPRSTRRLRNTLSPMTGTGARPPWRHCVSFNTIRFSSPPDGTACQQVAGATEGRVNPGDSTWKKLAVAPPQGTRDLRVLTGGKTVYLAASGDQLAATIAHVNSATFQPAFRARIIALINQIF